MENEGKLKISGKDKGTNFVFPQEIAPIAPSPWGCLLPWRDTDFFLEPPTMYFTLFCIHSFVLYSSVVIAEKIYLGLSTVDFATVVKRNYIKKWHQAVMYMKFEIVETV